MIFRVQRDYSYSYRRHGGKSVNSIYIYIDAIFSKAIILLVSRYLTDGDLKVPGGMGLLSIFTKHL